MGHYPFPGDRGTLSEPYSLPWGRGTSSGPYSLPLGRGHFVWVIIPSLGTGALCLSHNPFPGDGGTLYGPLSLPWGRGHFVLAIIPSLVTGALCIGHYSFPGDGGTFSGLLPLRSLINGPSIGVCFRESLVVRLHSEIDRIHLSSQAQGHHPITPR